VVESSCNEFFVWFWLCFFNYRCNVVVMLWVGDMIIPCVWKVVGWENVCVVGVVDLVEAAIVEVVPPLVSVDTEEFNGSFVSLSVLVKVPGVNMLGSCASLVIFEVYTPFEVLWKIIEFSSGYGFVSIDKTADYVDCRHVVM
jgi:hypothetical protein